jgi:hypothetical protein
VLLIFLSSGFEAVFSKMVLLERIELSTSPLPMVCSTTELQQRDRGCDTMLSPSWQELEKTNSFLRRRFSGP